MEQRTTEFLKGEGSSSPCVIVRRRLPGTGAVLDIKISWMKIGNGSQTTDKRKKKNKQTKYGSRRSRWNRQSRHPQLHDAKQVTGLLLEVGWEIPNDVRSASCYKWGWSECWNPLLLFWNKFPNLKDYRDDFGCISSPHFRGSLTSLVSSPYGQPLSRPAYSNLVSWHNACNSPIRDP